MFKKSHNTHTNSLNRHPSSAAYPSSKGSSLCRDAQTRFSLWALTKLIQGKSNTFPNQPRDIISPDPGCILIKCRSHLPVWKSSSSTLSSTHMNLKLKCETILVLIFPSFALTAALRHYRDFTRLHNTETPVFLVFNGTIGDSQGLKSAHVGHLKN